jgi:hypothetical protein
MKAELVLRIQRSKVFGGRGEMRRVRSININDSAGKFVDKFFLMAAAIDDDIESAEGSGAKTLEGIRSVEAGDVDKVEADGNAWVAHITREKVWFESLYNQGAGGEVTFAQYKLAVQTYVRFLADPEHQAIEVPYPAQ